MELLVALPYNECRSRRALGENGADHREKLSWEADIFRERIKALKQLKSQI